MTIKTVLTANIYTQVISMSAQLDPKNLPEPSDGETYLVEGRDFPKGIPVAIGMIWDGTKNPETTGFFLADPEAQPKTQTDALDQAEAKLREGLDLIAAARALG